MAHVFLLVVSFSVTLFEGTGVGLGVVVGEVGFVVPFVGGASVVPFVVGASVDVDAVVLCVAGFCVGASVVGLSVGFSVGASVVELSVGFTVVSLSGVV